MSIVLRQLFVFLRVLNSEKATGQIAAGAVCGVILGLAPVVSFQTAIVFVVIFLFRVQFGAALATAFFVKMVAFPLDPLFHWIGFHVLERPGLEPLFSWMNNVPVIPWTRFYNTVVMGSAVVSMVLAVPVYFGTKALVRRYRETVFEWFKNSRFWKYWRSTTIYNWYQRYEQFF